MATDIVNIASLFVIKVLLVGSDMQAEHKQLSVDPQIETVLTASQDPAELLQLSASHKPDIIILSEQDSIEQVDELCLTLSLANRNTKLMVISNQPPDLNRLRASGYKCRGYLTYSQRERIAHAIKVVYEGEAWLPRKLVSELLDHFCQESGVSPVLKLVKF